MTRIKICGLTGLDSALTAAEAGADFLGLVFAKSTRQISPENARQLIETVRGIKNPPVIVGVFVNETPQEVNRIAEYCRLDRVQFSGDEDWEYCREIDSPIIKAIHIRKEQDTGEVVREIEQGYKLRDKDELICLLDTHDTTVYGGTGQVFNWKLAEEVSAEFPVMVAGGLVADNVSQLVKNVRPWGVDVSSGVETGGQKDISKIRDFIKAVRESNNA